METSMVESFKKVFESELKKFEIDLEEISKKNHKIPAIKIPLKRCCYQILEKNIWQLSYKVFVYEFHQFREKNNYPIDKNSSIAYNHYVCQFDEKTIVDWFKKYPIYHNLIENVIKNLLKYMIDVNEHYYNDYHLLSSTLFGEDTKIEQIYPMDSDPHNGGKVVLCFVSNRLHKVIYKPRSLSVDKLVREIFQNALDLPNILGFIPVPLSIDCESYGWQEYIEKSHVNECDLNESYFNLGYCSAVYSCLGAADLHDENIIFNNNHPYFIDLETTFQPANNRGNSNLIDSENEMLLNSIITTSIIPSKLSVFPHDILIGGINTVYPQETEEMSFRLKNMGTDGIDIVKEAIKSSKKSTSFLFDNPSEIRPLEYQVAFLEGYEMGYHQMLQSKDTIKKIVSEGQCTLRIVLRPTTQYYLLIDACLFPENLISLEMLNNNVLNYIKPSKMFMPDVDARKVVLEENKMLIAGDIPYFYIDYDSNYLKSNSGLQLKCFELSPKENLLNRLDKSSEKQLILDKRFIAEGYSYIRMVELKFRENLKIVEKNSILFEELLNSLESLDTKYMIEFLIENSIENKCSEKMGWITGIYGDSPISYNSTMQVSFFDSAGIFFVFEHIENGEEYTKKIINGFEDFQNILHQDETTASDSIISGINSLSFLQSYKKQQLTEIEERLVASASYSNASDLFVDQIGVYHVLSTFLNSDTELIRSQLNSLDYSNSKFKKFGVAHGELGIKWAEFRLNQKMNNLEKCNSIFQNVLSMKNQMKRHENGWCNGNAGLLMVLAEMTSILNEKIDLFELADHCIVTEENREIDLSVCHGVAGIVQSLLFVYAVTEDSRYLDLANSFWEKIFIFVKKIGYYTGEQSRDYLMGYFLGWSGIIDTGILLKNYNRGEKSFIPLNLSSKDYQEKLFNKN